MNWAKFAKKLFGVLDGMSGASVVADQLERSMPRPRRLPPPPPPPKWLPPVRWCSCGPQAPQGPYPACGPDCNYGYQPGNQSVAYSKYPGWTPPPPDPDTIDPVVEEWTFNQYQEEALKTANCPLIGHPAVYPLLGLVGEMGEVYEKLTQATRSSMMKVWKHPYRGEIIKEIGDVLWYVAVMADRLGVKMEDISMPGVSSMTQYALVYAESDNTKATSYDIQLSLERLSICQGKLVERVKKVFRDGGGDFVGGRWNTIIVQLAGLLLELATLCSVMKIDFSLVAQMNIQKLQSRRERNAIQGEGDNR